MGSMDEWDEDNDRELREWVQRIREGLVPKLNSSSVVVSIAPRDGQGDVKFAVELGFSIMMDKPIIIVLEPGTRIPDKLVKVADVIVEGDMTTDEGRMKLLSAISHQANRLVK